MLFDVNVGVIEVRLVWREGAEIPLAVIVAVVDASPGRSAECGAPVVRWFVAVTFAVAEIEARAFSAAGLGQQCCLEPLVFVAAVAGHQVHQDLDVVLFGICEQRVEVGERAIFVVDAEVVGNVVAVVLLWARVARVEPDGIDAQRVQMIESRSDALDVADPIAR